MSLKTHQEDKRQFLADYDALMRNSAYQAFLAHLKAEEASATNITLRDLCPQSQAVMRKLEELSGWLEAKAEHARKELNTLP